MYLLRKIALILIVLVLFWPATADAQDEDWRDLATDYFVILYTPDDSDTAQEYAGFVDNIYEELAAVFNHRTATPLTLRLYPTMESYHAVNPLARNMPGVVAHADFRKRELVVVLTQTAGQSFEGVQNNVRHELTHIIAADLSDNRLNTGFQEGIAQYVEIPTDELNVKINALRVMRDQGRLLAWSDFEDRDMIYGKPEIGYPQTLSSVAFLIEEYGFGKFREFLTITARSSGYRSALERAYGISPADLETQWRDWLPSYIAEGYRQSSLTGYDMNYPRQLLQQGRYTEAQEELEHAIEILNASIEGVPDTQQQQAFTEAEELRTAIQQGQQAEQLAGEARSALEAGDYQQAAQLVEQAQALYAGIGDSRQDEVLRTYADRAARGVRAETQLAQAGSLVQTLRLPQARRAADTAAVDFAALGDNQGLEQALDLRSSLDWWQRLLGTLLVVLGVVGVTLSLLGGFYRQEREVW